MDIADVSINSASKYGKVGWFEGTVTVFEGDKIRRFSMDFPVSELKELGVCKNLNGWNKVREWANSDAGHEYIIKNKDRKDMLSILRAEKEGESHEHQ